MNEKFENNPPNKPELQSSVNIDSDAVTNHSGTKINELSLDARFRRIAQWASVTGTGMASLFFFFFLVWHVLNPGPANGWLVNIIDEQYAATVGVPLSAVTAFCIVTLLNVISKGDIEFSFLGMSFKGASGPVILWVICFLTVVFGFSLLWES